MISESSLIIGTADGLATKGEETLAVEVLTKLLECGSYKIIHGKFVTYKTILLEQKCIKKTTCFGKNDSRRYVFQLLLARDNQ